MIQLCVSANVLIFCCLFYIISPLTTCSQNEIQLSSYDCPKIQPQKPIDCADILNMGNNRSGVYEIWPINGTSQGEPLSVYCDMDTDGGGWTVIQRRGNFKIFTDFFLHWKSYKKGFGNIEHDFWLGNDNIFALTNQKAYTVRFDLGDFMKSRRFAHYQTFYIDHEYHKYTLHISEYIGDAGDSMSIHDKMPFSTRDFDYDNLVNRNCAELAGGGWWYNNCYNANLNGKYYIRKHPASDGIIWATWKGNTETLEWTEVKIRPKQYGCCSS